MERREVAPDATRTLFAKQRRFISFRLISLVAGAALAGGTPYALGADTSALGLAGPENQNELTAPFNDITVEMHEGTNMAAVPSPDGTQMVLSLQGGLWIIPANGGTAKKITPSISFPNAFASVRSVPI